MPPPRCGWSGRCRGTKAETGTQTGTRSVREVSRDGTERDHRAGGGPDLTRRETVCKPYFSAIPML